MEKSTNKVEIVPVSLEPHPNADSLSIVRVYGYTVIVRTQDWPNRNIGAYIPPDSIVPDTEEFSFLKGKRRIKACNLRGVVSFGMLVPAPEGAQLGENVAEQLGITHYEPPITWKGTANAGADTASPPPIVVPTYDVDALRRYPHIFQEGEPVWVTEKIHGANARYVFWDGQMYVGTRRVWRKEDPNCPWWRALGHTPALDQFCRENPGVVVYGEIYGDIQDLKYECGPGEIKFAAFDIRKDGRWLNAYEAVDFAPEIPWVPYRGIHSYNLLHLEAMAQEDSRIGNHLSEGIVVKPLRERGCIEVGRVILKLVSSRYLERA